MASTYILVPEQMYKGLTNIDPDNIPLEFERNALSKAKNVRKTPSAKNTLVNQELRRYLAMRNEHVNKPVKVELTNGAKGIIMPNQNPQPATGYNIRTPGNSRRSSNASVLTPSIASTDGYESAQANIFTDDDEEPTLMDVTLATSNSVPAIRNKMYRLYDHINQHYRSFGVVGDKILNRNGEPMPQSDLMQSIERLVDPSTYNMPSPVGTSYLRAAISKDPTATSIFNERLPPPRGPKRQPLSTLYKQEFQTPKRTQSTIKKKKITRGNEFRPQLWH